ncbi:phospholipid/cholesterol/gamma-HCH transport system permease protein [Mycolicibacterium sp. BK556]|uniref:ABC transporter permease n=1 Tax=unclassified Mycolicibacterium TaxID=2636767 RepID=UPI00161CBD2B|nr:MULTISPECIES: ABC transporter permease [unclassified Mycolicibacterium]MBB3604783.1 phospholipid/cholesterol/gamma-HCH transport system permease protein [Mycolicibacterium sp. BK556]MBB3634504.1 phospholipid/cholesterol/gamma-HCH transport system permease protein [Mycolicibacterium sp. BK607]
MAAPSSVLGRAGSAALDATKAPVRGFGQWVLFVGQVFYYLPLTVRRYSRQTLAATINMAWGRGSMIVDGGTISVLLLLGAATGATLGIEALAVLNILGFGPLAGIISGIGAVRVLGPIVAGIAFMAQAGTRMTAEIGAMRIAEEIDAVEAIGLRPIPFVVGTRLIGALTCVVPGYLLTLIGTFYTIELVVVLFNGEHAGTYDHYFVMFLSPMDLLYSTIKVSVYCVAVTLIHCYYGYFASGGPVGVGMASGRAVRASLVTIVVLDLTTSILIWGLQPVFIFKG